MTTAIVEAGLRGAEFVIRSLQADLDQRDAEIMDLRARLGDDAPRPGGVATLHRMRALEDAADAARTHLLGGPVSREDALAAVERARRAS